MAQQEGKRLKTADQAGTTYEGSAKSPSYYAVAAPTSDKNIQNQKERLQLDSSTRLREVDRTNTAEARALQVKQQSFANFQKNQQLKEKNQLEEAQYVDKANTKMEGDFLIAETDIQGRGAVAKEQVKGANLQATQTLVKGLTSLSGSFMDYQNDMAKIQEQANIDAQSADFLGGGVNGAIISQGQQAEAAQRDIEVAGETAVQGATDDVTVQHDIRSPQAEGRKQNNQTRINTIELGAGMYGGMADTLNDSSIIVRFPDGSERPITDYQTHSELEFVINIARSEYIRQNGGIAGLSSAELQILTNQAANAAQQIRGTLGSDMQGRMEQERVDTARQLFQTTIANDGDLGAALRDMADSYYTSGIYKTRAEATKAAITDAVAHASNMNGGRGDRDLIGSIQNIPMRVDGEGNPIAGSEAWTYAGDDINAAAQESFGDEEAQTTQIRNDINDDMYEDLRTLQEEGADRATIVERIEQSALALEEAGDYEGARDLRGQAADLSLPGNAAIVSEQLSTSIATGELQEQGLLDDALADGRISATTHRTLSTQLEEKNKERNPTDAESNKLGAATVKGVWSEFTASLGITSAINADGTENLTGLPAGLTQREVEVLKGQMTADVNRVVNEALASNPELLQPGNEREKQALVQQVLRAWVVDNVQSPEGKYYTGDYVKDTDKGNARLEKLKRMVRTGDGLVDLSLTSQPTAIRQQDYTSQINDGVVPGSVRNTYNPARNDIVMTRNATLIAIEEFNEGRISPTLSKTAQGLGITPRALLGQQRAAWSFDMDIQDPALSRPTSSSVQLRASGEQMTPVQGAQMLVTMGFPSKGASWLAGNIETESSWYGQRPPWDDVGAPAGGLVSWRADRLEALEARFGRPVSQITDSEQLTFMINEMRVKYPQAYATFMNPYATDRQLIAASKAYWGYGEEGGRYDNARAIESQI